MNGEVIALLECVYIFVLQQVCSFLAIFREIITLFVSIVQVQGRQVVGAV